MLIAVAISSGSSLVCAQSDQPPDLRMLLNLDLFKANATAQNSASGGDGSMLEQIQTLNALGYLGEARTAPANSTAPENSRENPGPPPPNIPYQQPMPRAPEEVE
jgi:hypothetical protein